MRVLEREREREKRSTQSVCVPIREKELESELDIVYLQGEREKEISLCEIEMCVRKIEKEYLWMKERERECVCNMRESYMPTCKACTHRYLPTYIARVKQCEGKWGSITSLIIDIMLKGRIR